MSRSRSRVLTRAFVRRVIQDVFGDYLDLIEREGTTSCFRAVEDSVRRRSKIPAHDLLILEDAVKQAVPEEYRADIASALNALSDAFTDELVVQEETAYLVGLTVGQTFSTSIFPDVLSERPA